MGRLVVGADAEDDRVALAELVVGVADPARLGSAAGRVVARIEVEDDRPAAELRELDALAGVARQLEIGCLEALLDHAATLYIGRPCPTLISWLASPSS